MNSDALLKTMIEYIKYEEVENKTELLAILRGSKLSFDKTRAFTSKSWQYWENIDIRVPYFLYRMYSLLRENTKVSLKKLQK